ncbi:MAG: efflux RND transporter periplasmic adaptor subunit [Balneolaceae bacterium]|nr:efflux RND transporter periplasmic adaptor subunit [Balneolaceae bacterium]
MRKIVSGVLVLIVSAAVFYLLSGNNEKRTGQKPAAVSQTAGLEFLTIETEPISELIHFDGRVQAKERIELFPEVAGIFLRAEYSFREGVRFNRGDVLVRIDDTEAALQLQSSRSAFRNLVSSLMPDILLDYPDYADRFERYLEEIDSENSLAQLPDVADNQLCYFLSSRGLYERFYQIKSAEKSLEKFVIHAPFDGILTASNVREGSRVSPQTHLGTFISNHDFEFTTTLSKEAAAKLTPGIKAELSNRSGTGEWIARVSEINPSVDRRTQSVRVFMDLEGDGLMEGLYLTGQIKTGDQEERAVIPRSALLRTGHVYKLNGETVQMTPVEVDLIEGNRVWVSGLQSGDVIIANPERPLSGLQISNTGKIEL